MKFKGGKSYFNTEKMTWEYEPRIYTNFYCSLYEWGKLNRGKENFVNQLLDKVRSKLNNGKIPTEVDEFEFTNINDGIHDEENVTSVYCNNLMQEVIKEMTGRDSEVIVVTSGCWDILHVEITFPGTSMPNIIVLIDYDYLLNYTWVLKCIRGVYDTLSLKTTHRYERDLQKWFNSDYDRLYITNIDSSSGVYGKWYRCYEWEKQFQPKKNRGYCDSGVLDYYNKKTI